MLAPPIDAANIEAMPAAVERKLTLFADHPDPTRDMWIGFVEVMVRHDDGSQAIDVYTLDENFASEAAALAAAEAWVAQYKSAVQDPDVPLIVVRL
ncbi:MAG: hypothetical protein U1F10_13210 [Burkholderiales bacterium]